MPKLVLLSFLLLTSFFTHCSLEQNTSQPLRVMTFNVRVNVESDSLNAWPYRKAIVASMIRFHKAEIIGVQEDLSEQVSELAGYLPDYNWIGVGRDDGDTGGEYMAIFYLKKRFNLLADSTFWLSETPKKPGLGWDAACNRVVTWGKFEDKITSKTFFLFNTHFDHKGEIARKESAELLLKKIDEIAGTTNIIVTGDFNCTPKSVPYKIITNKNEETSLSTLADTRLVSKNPPHGPNYTFTGFKTSRLFNNDRLIDYIFVGKTIKVLNHGVLSDSFDGFFPSDHFPVLAELLIA